MHEELAQTSTDNIRQMQMSHISILLTARGFDLVFKYLRGLVGGPSVDLVSLVGSLSLKNLKFMFPVSWGRYMLKFLEKEFIKEKGKDQIQTFKCRDCALSQLNQVLSSEVSFMMNLRIGFISVKKNEKQ